MNKQEIQEVLELFEQSSVAKLELEVETFKIKLEKFGAGSTNQNTSNETMKQSMDHFVTTKPSDNSHAGDDKVINKSDSRRHHIITAPLVGTYYSSRQQGEEPFVSVGSTVKVGDVLCIVEAMKVMNEIRADRAGVIKEINVNNEDMVQFKQPLFIMEEIL